MCEPPQPLLDGFAQINLVDGFEQSSFIDRVPHVPLARMVCEKPRTVLERAALQPLFMHDEQRNADPKQERRPVDQKQVPDARRDSQREHPEIRVWSQLERYAAGSRPLSESSRMRFASDFDTAANALEKHAEYSSGRFKLSKPSACR